MCASYSCVTLAKLSSLHRLQFAHLLNSIKIEPVSCEK